MSKAKDSDQTIINAIAIFAFFSLAIAYGIFSVRLNDDVIQEQQEIQQMHNLFGKADIK